MCKYLFYVNYESSYSKCTVHVFLYIYNRCIFKFLYICRMNMTKKFRKKENKLEYTAKIILLLLLSHSLIIS